MDNRRRGVVQSVSGEIEKFSDDFDRANSATLGNNWSSSFSSGAGGDFEINTNQAYMVDGGGDSISWVTRNLEDYSESKMPINIESDFKPKFGGATANSSCGLFVGNDGSTTPATSGTGVIFATSVDLGTASLLARVGGSTIDTYIHGSELVSESTYKLKTEITTTSIKAKFWLSTDSEPVGWQLDTAITFSEDGDYLSMYGVANRGSETSICRIDNLIINEV